MTSVLTVIAAFCLAFLFGSLGGWARLLNGEIIRPDDPTDKKTTGITRVFVKTSRIPLSTEQLGELKLQSIKQVSDPVCRPPSALSQYLVTGGTAGIVAPMILAVANPDIFQHIDLDKDVSGFTANAFRFAGTCILAGYFAENLMRDAAKKAFNLATKASKTAARADQKAEKAKSEIKETRVDLENKIDNLPMNTTDIEANISGQFTAPERENLIAEADSIQLPHLQKLVVASLSKYEEPNKNNPKNFTWRPVSGIAKTIGHERSETLKMIQGLLRIRVLTKKTSLTTGNTLFKLTELGNLLAKRFEQKVD